MPNRSTTSVLGTVKTLVTDKGYGFILADDGTEYFFHHTAAPTFDTLRVGAQVRFIATQGPRGSRAESVELA